MATKAKTASKAKPKTKAKTASQKTTAKVVSSTAATSPLVTRLATVSPQSLIGEAVGTLGLALVALTAPADQPLATGIGLTVLLLGLMKVSGGHFNPAVTFGLWAINKLDTVKVPFYWAAQLIGGLAALLIVGAYNGNGSTLDFSNSLAWDWRIFFLQATGAAIFLFGLVAAIKNISTSSGRAAGIGLSFFVGLVVAGGLVTANATREQDLVQVQGKKEVSQAFAVQSTSLNPAIALGQTERDVKAINDSISGKATTEEQKEPTHFTLPTVLGALFGAALGANLYLILAGLSWKSKEL